MFRWGRSLGRRWVSGLGQGSFVIGLLLAAAWVAAEAPAAVAAPAWVAVHHAPGVVVVTWVAEGDAAAGFVVLQRVAGDATDPTGADDPEWIELGRVAADVRSWVAGTDAGDAEYGVIALGSDGSRSAVSIEGSRSAPSAATVDPPGERRPLDIEVLVLDLRGAVVPFAEVRALVRGRADGGVRTVGTWTDAAGTAGLNSPYVFPALAPGAYDVFLVVAYPHGAPAAAVLRRTHVDLPGRIVVDPRAPGFVDLTLWAPQADPSAVGGWRMLEWAVPPVDEAILIGGTPIDAGTLLRVEPGAYVIVSTFALREGGSARLWAPLELTRGGSTVLGDAQMLSGGLEVSYATGPTGGRPDRVDVVVAEDFGDPLHRAGCSFGEGVLRLSAGAWWLRLSAAVEREDGTWWFELAETLHAVAGESPPIAVRFGGDVTLAVEVLELRADPPTLAVRAVARDEFANPVRVVHWSPIVDHRATLVPAPVRYRIVGPDGGEAGAGEATAVWRREGMVAQFDVPLGDARAHGAYRLEFGIDTGPFAGWVNASGVFSWP